MGCFQNSQIDCTKKVYNFGGQKYSAEGCLVNGIENGHWRFLTVNNKVKETGRYIDGIRVGEWRYPIDSIDSVILWEKFEKTDMSLVLNIPTKLEVIANNPEYITFSNNDTSNLFNLGISIRNIGNIEDYNLKAENEILRMGWNFSVLNDARLYSKMRIFFLKEYRVFINKDLRFHMLNAYGIMKDGMLLEIACRYNENIEASAKRIFFAVFTNTFYKRERFISPFEELNK